MSELREWLEARKSKPRTIKELSQMFKGVPYKTVASWVEKGSIPVKPELKKKLYELTKIDKYMPDELKKQKIDEVIHDLYSLINSLEPLKQSEALREYFRKKINKSDVAYLSSFLEVLLDEKRFQMWNSFQNIPTKEVKKNGRKGNL